MVLYEPKRTQKYSLISDKIKRLSTFCGKVFAKKKKSLVLFGLEFIFFVYFSFGIMFSDFSCFFNFYHISIKTLCFLVGVFQIFLILFGLTFFGKVFALCLNSFCGYLIANSLCNAMIVFDNISVLNLLFIAFISFVFVIFHAYVYNLYRGVKDVKKRNILRNRLIVYFLISILYLISTQFFISFNIQFIKLG